VSSWVKLREGAASLRSPGSTVLGFVVVLYAVAVVGKAEDVPSGAWDAGKPLGVVLLILAAVSTVGYWFVTVSYGRSLRNSEDDRLLTSTCHEIAYLVANALGTGPREVGAHVWTVGGPRFARHLRRRATVRPVGHRKLPIIWLRGKGAIGHCWATQETFVADLDDLAQLGPDEATFCALDPETRLRLTWHEWQISDYYRAIWATPLHVGPEGAPALGGCVSVDVRQPNRAHDLERIMKERADDLRPFLEICQRVLSG
jgi:hypothetical protein